MPLVRAAATEVPEPRSQRPAEAGRRRRPEHAHGGADHVGLEERAGRVAGAGPRDQPLGGARTPSGRSDTPAPAGGLRSQARSTLARRPWSGGRSARRWKSAVTWPRLVLTSTMPAPSARCTASDLSTRPMPPRSHTTMRPATRAASRLPGRQRRDCAGVDPAAVPRAPSTTRAGCVWSRAAIAPVSRRPGATTAPRRVAPVVPPTEVTQGEAWAAYPVVPRLPDAPTTTMSASAAPSSARSRMSMPAGRRRDRRRRRSARRPGRPPPGRRP